MRFVTWNCNGGFRPVTDLPTASCYLANIDACGLAKSAKRNISKPSGRNTSTTALALQKRVRLGPSSTIILSQKAAFATHSTGTSYGARAITSIRRCASTMLGTLTTPASLSAPPRPLADLGELKSGSAAVPEACGLLGRPDKIADAVRAKQGFLFGQRKVGSFPVVASPNFAATDKGGPCRFVRNDIQLNQPRTRR